MRYMTFPTQKQIRAAFLTTCVIAVLAALLAGELDAQSLWTSPEGQRGSLAIEMLRPNFSDEELAFEGATGAMIITGRLQVMPSLVLVADLPLSRAAWSLDGESGTSNLFGNPYLGAEWRAGQRLVAEGGIRIPMGDLEDLDQLAPMLVGMAGEIERLEAFAPETFGVYAAAAWRQPLAEKLSLKLRGGTSFLAGDGGPEDLFLGYTGQLWYDQGRYDSVRASRGEPI